MEKELKIRLNSRDDYVGLKAALGSPVKSISQVNTYLETPANDLRARRIMARIRTQDGQLILGLKWKAERQEGFFVAQEREVDLDSGSVAEILESGQAASLLHELCPLLDEVALDELQILGSIHNTRLVFFRGGFQLELDHSRFGPGTEDYELELETDRIGEARLFVRELLELSGVRGEPQTHSKYERFLASQQAGPAGSNRPPLQGEKL